MTANGQSRLSHRWPAVLLLLRAFVFACFCFCVLLFSRLGALAVRAAPGAQTHALRCCFFLPLPCAGAPARAHTPSCCGRRGVGRSRGCFYRFCFALVAFFIALGALAIRAAPGALTWLLNLRALVAFVFAPWRAGFSRRSRRAHLPLKRGFFLRALARWRYAPHQARTIALLRGGGAQDITQRSANPSGRWRSTAVATPSAANGATLQNDALC